CLSGGSSLVGNTLAYEPEDPGSNPAYYHCVPDPPAPPPPPPLPPPPPPLGTQTPHASRKKRRVRSFFWKTIPEEKVRGKPNIWTMAVRQQQYQIDVRTVEELFGVPGVPRPQPASGAPCVSRSSFKESKDEVSILDSKRGMNVGILLKQFKKSNNAIVEDIRLGNSKLYGAEPLKELLKLLPEAEEVKKLKSFNGDPEKLPLVDSFMFLLIEVPRFDVRIEAMVLKEEFCPSCAIMSREISIIRLAIDELMNCEELHAILHLVLQAGNIMNAGGYAGNAVGFKLSSLLSLADTKANKPGMNLLHFVALEAQKKDEGLLNFPEKLQHVQSAARISVENIESEFSSLYVRTRSLEEKIQNDPELLQQLDPFLQNSTRTLQDLKRRRLDLRKEGNTLIDFFCEDKDTFKLDDCFRIFHDFCLKFKKAVKDNLDRKMKEAARQRRLQELEERRSIWAAAGGPSTSSGFGRSSSETDVDTLTKEGLLDFLLQSRSQSPHSTIGRSASTHRYRHHTATERNLRGYLELLAGTPSDFTKFRSLPRSGRTHQRKTMAWLASQDDNRELGPHNHLYRERQVTSPGTETEQISPLAQYSTDYNMNDDATCDHDHYASLSEGGFVPHSRNVFQKTSAQSLGHLKVTVETHTLVPGPEALKTSCPNNNSSNTQLDNGDVFVSDLEGDMRVPPRSLVLDTPPSSKSSEEAAKPEARWDINIPSPQKDDEEDSTVSSTTCDTPLPLDPSVSYKKPMFYILDCTETDCSMILDCSETDSFPVGQDGAGLEGRTLKDRSSRSSNLESASANDQSASISAEEYSGLHPADEGQSSVTPSATTDEADTDSVDTTEGQRVGGKAVQSCSLKPVQKGKVTSRASTGRTAAVSRTSRTSTPAESQGMRKVVPIKLSRSTSNVRRVERPAGHESGESRQLRDQSTPARRGMEKHSRPPRHSSLPPEESKAGTGTASGSGITRWARDPTPRKPSLRKPTAKPVRNVPKPVHEEKMCLSTMRALALAQAASESSVPLTPTHVSKAPSPIPSFARNTVASSSRTKKDSPSQSSPATPSKSSALVMTASHRASGSVKAESLAGEDLSQDEKKAQAPLKRAQSAKVSGRSSLRSDTLPLPRRERSRRTSGSFSEKSIQSSISISSKAIKPSWK
uniref:FH2 domain-containing protein n=1 Tax=Denticeps clupeoides TaxID=299321 RepID=A0AAY4A864_9TELE